MDTARTGESTAVTRVDLNTEGSSNYFRPPGCEFDASKTGIDEFEGQAMGGGFGVAHRLEAGRGGVFGPVQHTM